MRDVLASDMAVLNRWSEQLPSPRAATPLGCQPGREPSNENYGKLDEVSGSLERLIRVARGFQGRLCRGQPRDRHPERRAGHVIQSRLVAEANGIRIAAVLTANAEFQVRTNLSAPFHRDPHQFANPVY